MDARLPRVLAFFASVAVLTRCNGETSEGAGNSGNDAALDGNARTDSSEMPGSDGGASADSAAEPDASVDASAPGVGISCGTTICEAGVEYCCIHDASQSCTATTCAGLVVRLECDDTMDCPGSLCCFTNILQSALVTTMCMPDCTTLSSIQVCNQAADCRNGAPCRPYTCGIGANTAAVRLCTATAPYACH